jgi:hypothetical protein
MYGVRVVAFSAAGARIGGAVTNNDGEFVFQLPAAGDYRLQATRLGYATTITELITVDSAAQADVVLPMVRRPVALDTITVAGQPLAPAQKQLPYLVDAGFYRRQRWGFGYFLTRADIDRRDPLIMADLLKGIPGIRVRCTSATICSVTMPGANAMFIGKACFPSVVLDGVPGFSLADLNPFNLEAVEIYPHSGGVPVQWRTSPCGAVVAWSRR